MVCGGSSLLKEDEDKIHQTIYRTVMEKEKGFIAWLRNGQLTVDLDVMAQLLTDPCRPQGEGGVQAQVYVPMTTAAQRRNEASGTFDPVYEWKNTNWHQQVSYPPTTPIHTEQRPLRGKLLFKSKLRNGVISYAQRDVEVWSHEFVEGLLDVSTQSKLQQKYRFTEEIQLKIISFGNKLSICLGDHGIEMKDNDVLLLKTRIRKGLVSLHEDDVHVRYPGWTLPVDILEDLKRKEADGNLFVIVDEKGNLRCTVRKITRKETFWAFFA